MRYERTNLTSGSSIRKENGVFDFYDKNTMHWQWRDHGEGDQVPWVAGWTVVIGKGN